MPHFFHTVFGMFAAVSGILTILHVCEEASFMTIGIPRALLYHRYATFWTAFFEALGEQVLLSPETNKQILHNGTMAAIDESCLSSKVFLGHVEALIGKCDMVFIPRIASTGDLDNFCTKFEALPDIARNTFRSRGVHILSCNIDAQKGRGEMAAYMKIGKALKKKKAQALYAFMYAKQMERQQMEAAIRTQEALLAQPGLRVLVVGHPYNLDDAYIGKPVLAYIRALGALPIRADVIEPRLAREKSFALTDTLPWICNRELVGGVQQYRDAVDGVVLVSAFPCGPDSLVNDILRRRVQGLPMLQLVLDGQEGMAGLETRLESFVDILSMRREEAAHA